MDPIVATLAILVLAVVGFASGLIPIEIVALGVALALFLTGVLTLPEALAGFGDPTVLFIAGLFVVSEALDVTGITTWAEQKVIARAGTKRRTLMLVVGILVAVVSALISVNGAVAALVPLVVIVAARAAVPPSQMLMPLAFAASAGSMLLLTGTPVNIIVSEFAASNGGRPFGYFEFALAGIPLVVGTVLFLMFFAHRLLPVREGAQMPLDLARHARLLQEQYSLSVETSKLIGPASGVTEVMVAPRSSLIGAELFAGMATPAGDLVVLAARRGDSLLTGDVTVQAGDVLLVQGRWDDLVRHAEYRGVLPVDPPDRLRRSVALGRGARRTAVVLALMVILLATGVVPPAVASLLAAGALVVMRVVPVAQAYRSVSWTTIVLIAGMIPLATAFTTTGAADLIARMLLALIGGAGPQVTLLVLCVLTLILGQIISNAATILIVAPIALSAASAMDASIEPFLMGLAVVAAAAFLTPVATPANLMVMEPAGYRFGDYWKLGLPLALFFLTVGVVYVPLIWPF